MNGRVFWITGLPNSGKTTIGTALYYSLKRRMKNVVILDGDILKQIASGSEVAGYSEYDRLIRANRYSYLVKMLADQGLWVIICTISMFEDVRIWNRENIKGYLEIYLDVPVDILKMRDKKNIFNFSLDYQIPYNPDLVIKNYGSVSVKDVVDEILKLDPNQKDDYDRDKEYWNNYYKKIKNNDSYPSDFAVYVESKLHVNSMIFELGCGNGRDSLFFLKKGHSVTAVDSSDAAIDMLNEITADMDKALFVCDDFVKCHTLYQMTYDCIYSRFTLHAITEEQENELLNNVKNALNGDGIFCIEARTTKDEIYGCGTEVGKNSFFYNDHFRRFIDVESFGKKMTEMGFVIDYLKEDRGFSKTSSSDPFLMRCIARVRHAY